jgi:hypothetical protein
MVPGERTGIRSPTPVRKNDRPALRSDLYAGRKGEHIHNDHHVAERRELLQSCQPPAEPDIKLGLVIHTR